MKEREVFDLKERETSDLKGRKIFYLKERETSDLNEREMTDWDWLMKKADFKDVADLKDKLLIRMTKENEEKCSF